MRILITGGAGFIGSNFVRHVLQKHEEYEIVVLDKLTYAGRKENLQDISNHIEFIKGDIARREDVEKAMKECDSLVNFAAETHVDRSIEEPSDFILSNVYGTYNLLESARRLDMQRFEQISTDEVYGQIQEGRFDETDKLNPRNPYSASKASAELLCNAYFETYGLPVVITRSVNNYGPFQHPEKLVAKAIICALMNRPVPIYGTGENIRDWLYVEDNCEAIETVLNKGEAGESYNIAAHCELKNIEIVETILKCAKKTNLVEYVKDRPGHDLRYSLDTKKIERLGWNSKTGIEDGIRKTLEWYQKNIDWWKPTIESERINFHHGL